MNTYLVRDVLLLLFDDVEVLDFAGPYEVFSLVETDDARPLCRIRTVAATAVVSCKGGLRVRVDRDLDDAPPADALIVPGGPGARDKERSRPLVEFLVERARTIPLIASVCTGSFLLARSGLLDGGPATTHSRRFQEFATEFPHLRLQASKIVDRGHIITAGGVSSGIDLALHIVKRWFGVAQRNAVARRLEGPWQAEAS